MKHFSKSIIDLYQKVFQVKNCPWCGSEQFIKHAKYHYTYRYKCKKCKRTFLPSTGTSIHYIHKKDQFYDYANVLKNEGLLSLSTMCKKFNIAPLTSFDWRHKILMSIPRNDKVFRNETFCYNLQFNYSRKGRKGIPNPLSNIKAKGLLKDNKYKSQVISLRNTKVLASKLVTVGSVKLKDIKRSIGKNLCRTKCLVINHEIQGLAEFAKLKILNLIAIYKKSSEVQKRIFMENFNSLNLDFKGWINNIKKGVATKYLALYCNYFMAFYSKKFSPFAKNIINQKFVWPFYTLTEQFYKEFILNHTEMNYTKPTKRKWKTSIKYSFKKELFPY
jgi:transposase-like protein